MGSRITEIGTSVTDTEQEQKQNIEKEEGKVDEVKEAKSILDGIDGVDDDVSVKIEIVEESTVNEALDDIQTNVHGDLEQNYSDAENAIDQANEQQQIHDDASEKLASAESVSEYGSSAAEQAIENSDQVSGEAQELSEKAEQDMEQTESDYNRLLSDL